jgi:hypothetical protein
MSQSLWVEYRTEDSVQICKVSINDCILIKDLIWKIRGTPKLSVPKDFPLTLHGPSGTIINADDCPSSLISGNSQDTPIHVRVSVPLPVIEEQARNSALTSFWNSLRELSDEDGFLHFPVIPEFFPEGMKSIYVREAYRNMFKIIWKYVYPAPNEKRHHRIPIAGTPGIGKSVFLFYVLWRLARAGINNVVLDRGKDLKCNYVFRTDGCWVTSNFTESIEVLNDRNSWLLIDSHKSLSLLEKPITIYMTWPAKIYYRLFPASPGTTLLHFLPPWSLDELKKAAPLYSRDLKMVEARWHKIGGIPRFVLERETDLEQLVENAFEKLNFPKLKLVSILEVSEEDEILLLILHFFPDDSDYLRTTPRFAVPSISRMACDRLPGNATEDEMKDFLRHCFPEQAPP